MKNLFLLLSAALFAALSSCSNDEIFIDPVYTRVGFAEVSSFPTKAFNIRELLVYPWDTLMVQEAFYESGESAPKIKVSRYVMGLRLVVEFFASAGVPAVGEKLPVYSGSDGCYYVGVGQKFYKAASTEQFTYRHIRDGVCVKKELQSAAAVFTFKKKTDYVSHIWLVEEYLDEEDFDDYFYQFWLSRENFDIIAEGSEYAFLSNKAGDMFYILAGGHFYRLGE